MTLAEKLLELRTDRGLSQGDLAEKLDVSRQSVSKWETGQSVPDLDKIIKLADLFGVTVDDLVREEGRPQPEVSTPQVVYVEKKREPSPAQSLQVLGIACEAIGAALVVLGLMGMGVLLLLGVAFVILGLPLLLCMKHPFMIDGWLIVAMSWLILNPWTSITPMGMLGGIRRLAQYLTIPGARYPSNLFGICVALTRGLLTLALIAGTWRACRKKKDS